MCQALKQKVSVYASFLGLKVSGFGNFSSTFETSFSRLCCLYVVFFLNLYCKLLKVKTKSIKGACGAFFKPIKTMKSQQKLTDCGHSQSQPLPLLSFKKSQKQKRLQEGGEGATDPRRLRVLPLHTWKFKIVYRGFRRLLRSCGRRGGVLGFDVIEQGLDLSCLGGRPAKPLRRSRERRG